MTMDEAIRCMAAGRQAVIDVVQETQAKVLVLGEVGIGNTTATSALTALLLLRTATSSPSSTQDDIDVDVAKVCGGGATTTRSVDEQAVQRKIQLVQQAVQRHAGNTNYKTNPVELLAAVGGAEIAALVGAFLECSDQNLPVLCDGFIVSAAAGVALRLNPAVARILFLSTASAEPGHALLLNEMMREISTTSSNATTNGDAVLSLSPPVLNMGLRMGEGTAGLLALPLLRSAASIWNEMGTIHDILGQGNGATDTATNTVL